MVRSEAIVGTDLLVLRSTRDVRGSLRAARDLGAVGTGPVSVLLLSDGELVDLERSCRILALTLREHAGEVRVLVRKQELGEALADLQAAAGFDTLWVLPQDREAALRGGHFDVRALETVLQSTGNER